MLKKIDFNMMKFNYTEQKFGLTEYSEFIFSTIETPVIYNFEYETPFVIHILDNVGDVIYHEALCLINNRVVDYTSIAQSHETLTKAFKLLINTPSLNTGLWTDNNIYVNIYIYKYYVENVNMKYSAMCMNDSLAELEKMYRDINLFQNK